MQTNFTNIMQKAEKFAVVAMFSICIFAISQSRAFSQTVDVPIGPDLIKVEQTPQSVKDVSISIIKGTQSPIDMGVPITLTLNSKDNFQNVRIFWETTPNGTKFSQSKDIWTSIEKEKNYTFKTVVYPLKAGQYRVVGNVELWESEANYLRSDKIDLEFDTKFELTPSDSDYQLLAIIWLIIKILVIVASLFGLFFLSKFLVKSFKEWLARD